MERFHINKNGVPARCKAQPGKCPLGGEESHYNNEKDAQIAADKQNEQMFGLVPIIDTANPKGDLKQLPKKIVIKADDIFKGDYDAPGSSYTEYASRARNQEMMNTISQLENYSNVDIVVEKSGRKSGQMSDIDAQMFLKRNFPSSSIRLIGSYKEEFKNNKDEENLYLKRPLSDEEVNYVIGRDDDD